MAIKEGNTCQLAHYYELSASSYACLNQEEMMVDGYERVIHLLQYTKWNEQENNKMDLIYYNLGSTYISLKQYEKCLFYFEKISEKIQLSFSVLHKKAMVYLRLGEKKKAEEFLEKAKKALLSENDSLPSDWLKYEETKYELVENYLENPKYLELLEKLMKQLEKEQHFGHIYFYREQMMEAYIKQRKYKRALEFERKISSFIIKNSI